MLIRFGWDLKREVKCVVCRLHVVLVLLLLAKGRILFPNDQRSVGAGVVLFDRGISFIHNRIKLAIGVSLKPHNT